MGVILGIILVGLHAALVIAIGIPCVSPGMHTHRSI